MEEEYRKKELEIKKKRVLEELKNNKFEFKELQQNITNPLQDILAFNQSVDKMYKTIQSTYKTNIEVMQQIAQRALKQSIDNSQIFKEFNVHIKEMMDSIDWEAIDARIATKIKGIDNLLQELEKEFLCLDMEIFDALEGGEVTDEDILEYINQNLESYVEVITRDPIYELHETLIKETYEAYKGGLYKLCVMPLFAAFEHVIATWSDGKINTNLVSVRQKPERYRVTKIKPEEYIDIEQEQYIKVFSLSVLRMIGKTFVGVPKELCQELNRNSIAHGFHDYDSITKEDILKLFQLLKSTLVLRYFNVKDAEL
ncbi:MULTISPECIES: hypothetical protein [Bacillus cereus group]|uniref:hypothetical protein n=1 Tax=Bacillus cereus group TaxID=86661 RepID=UPI001A7F0CEF|nr:MULTISPECIES: hypothetical protein [Bacillus cereus group]CAH2462781.1 hypothetical protein ACOSJ1_EBGNOMHC_00125 [Bacillus mycoides KBAB4]